MKKLLVLMYVIFISFLFGCNKIIKNGQYHITYEFNGGSTDEEYSETFNESSKVILPNPTKDGFIFAGWVSDSLFVTTLDEKDYTLTAVWFEPYEYTNISESEIFNQEQKEYFVYIYRDSCSWCNKIKNDVLTYLYKSSLPQYNASIKLYTINLTEGGQRASIFRRYDGEDSPNSNGFYVDDAQVYSDICIPSTPALIKIEASDDKQSAKLLASGASLVVKEANKGLVPGQSTPELREKYVINLNVNGGNLDSENQLSFYSWNEVKLPIPEKDGAIFKGWYENETKISDIEPRNYNLKAEWTEIVEAPTIICENMFKQSYDEYYICIIKSDYKDSQDVLDMVSIYYSIMGTQVPIYVIDLSKDPINFVICHSYLGENGQGPDGRFYVDGVKKVEDLYIAVIPALIHIKTIDNEKVSFYASYNKNIVNYLTDILY